MFWETYGSAVRWMFAVEAVAGGIILAAIQLLYVPSEPGQQPGDVFIMAIFGSLAGVLTATTASLVYRLCLGVSIRRPRRSIASRAWIGTGAAGLGALALWAVGGVYGMLVGLIPTLIAMVVAGPLTVRAARRADIDAKAIVSIDPSESLT